MRKYISILVGMMILLAVPAQAQQGPPTDWDKNVSPEEVQMVMVLVRYLYAETVNTEDDDTRVVDCAIDLVLKILHGKQEDFGRVTRRDFLVTVQYNFRQIDRGDYIFEREEYCPK